MKSEKEMTYPNHKVPPLFRVLCPRCDSSDTTVLRADDATLWFACNKCESVAPISLGEERPLKDTDLRIMVLVVPSGATSKRRGRPN